ncbi:MAG: rhodanese-like domain-containing protein [Gammaproteobacteria bacterium]
MPYVSAAELGEVDATRLIALQHEQNALIIDIRTEREWTATGVIPGSQKLEFFNAEGLYDTEQWLDRFNRLRISPDQPVILICRSGNRSSRVGQLLAQKLGIKNIYHLKSGILSWIKAGHPIIQGCTEKSVC